ncbi:hypothetical protein K0M31_001534 [Melipona bicolor]|uniref:Uncharacterized protein n=1 Tax=Melipona bicolor TaxID=60889 RepID=A0AA40GFP5_9HYME|nr:hypothetical protein K0M31_001534 [Melipona bicolor]
MERIGPSPAITQSRHGNGLPIGEKRRIWFPVRFGRRAEQSGAERSEAKQSSIAERQPPSRHPPRSRGNLPRQSMPRNWEFYNIFGSEPVSLGEEPRHARKEREGQTDRWKNSGEGRTTGYTEEPEGQQPLGKIDILFLRAAPRQMKNAHG